MGPLVFSRVHDEDLLNFLSCLTGLALPQDQALRDRLTLLERQIEKLKEREVNKECDEKKVNLTPPGGTAADFTGNPCQLHEVMTGLITDPAKIKSESKTTCVREGKKSFLCRNVEDKDKDDLGMLTLLNLLRKVEEEING